MSTFPLSPSKRAGNLLFVSGQIGQQDGRLVSRDLEQQVVQTVNNIKKILEQNELTIKDVVDATVFLIDQKDYDALNKAYKKVFQEPYPTRTVITIKSLPLAAKVEIKVIAAKFEPPVIEVGFQR